MELEIPGGESGAYEPFIVIWHDDCNIDCGKWSIFILPRSGKTAKTAALRGNIIFFTFPT